MDAKTLKLVAAVVILAAALALLLNSGEATVDVGQRYFYDVESGKLFAAPASALPPIDAPSGSGNGVRAEVISCGECTDGQMRIVYLERYNEAAIHAAQNPGVDPDIEDAGDRARHLLEGTLVAREPGDGEDIAWYSAASPAGQAIQAEYHEHCGGKPNACAP